MSIVRLVCAIALLMLSQPVFAQNVPPIGDLELPGYGSTVRGAISTSGWALDLEDSVILVRVYVDEVYAGRATYPAGNRPDIQIAFPEVSHSLFSGYGYTLDTTTLSDGLHHVSVTAADSQGEIITIGQSAFTVDNAMPQVARPWPDTTSGVLVFNDQIADYITIAQTQFCATHYVGCQKVIRSFADALRSYNSNFLILHYRLGLGLGYQTPGGEWLHIIEGNNWVREWPAIQQDQWFYPYAGYPRVYQNQWGWYLIEPDNTAWRTYWSGEVTRQMQVNDDDGLFADSTSVPNYMGAENFTPNLPDNNAPFESTWSGKIQRWISYLKGVFGNDYMLIPNVGLWITTRDLTDYSGADGVMVEGFGAWDQWDFFALDDWQLQMDRILSLASQDKIIINQAYIGDATDTAFRMYTLANYLLIKGAKTYINMDISAEPEWFPEYSVAIGSYLGNIPTQISDLYRADWGVYARQYSGGMAVVNPSDTTRTFNVSAGCKRVVPHGGGIVPQDGTISEWYCTLEPVSQITLGPNSGAVLLSDGPAPGTLSVTPDAGFSPSGFEHGPFTQSTEIYTIRNVGGQAINWTAAHNPSVSWLAVNPQSGALSAGASLTVSVSLTSAADSLASGIYQDTVSLTNATNGVGNTTRAVQLSIASPSRIGYLQVTPESNFASSGGEGGPFTPDRAIYTIANPGDSSIDFSITHQLNGNWVTLYQTLTAHQSLTMGFAINSMAAALGPGTHTDTVTFTNITTGEGTTTRSVQVTVLAANMSVTPADAFTSSGQQGGPFSPSTKSYMITNTGTVSLNWQVSKGAAWLGLSQTSGTLSASASTTLTATINSNANTLTGGIYNDTLTFTNVNNGRGNTTRAVTLTVVSKSLASVDVLPSSMTCPSNDSRLIYARAFFSDGSSVDITSTGIWTTSNSAVATVNSQGVVTPKTQGTINVTCSYTYGSTTRSDSCSVTVRYQSVHYLSISPSGFTFYQYIPQQFVVQARTSLGWITVTDQCAWTSTAPTVATVDAHGLVTPVSKGATTIKAVYVISGSSKSTQASVNVQ